MSIKKIIAIRDPSEESLVQVKTFSAIGTIKKHQPGHKQDPAYQCMVVRTSVPIEKRRINLRNFSAETITDLLRFSTEPTKFRVFSQWSIQLYMG
jgi:hypothetical protein